MLRVENLKKVFNIDGQEDVQALRGVSFSMVPGEFFTLLGPSGSGKSTLIRCVAGLESPEDGEIHIGDVLVYSKQKNVYVPTEQRPIGMVFQSYAIWPHMSVFDNVAFPLIHGARSRADRVPRSEVQDRVHEALSLVKLQDFGKRATTQLSGGQQQRVALARALVAKPRLLLLDEPLSNLDAKLREETREELKDLVGPLDITTLYVTHDQAEALTMSDRIGVMRDGNLLGIGTPYELYAAPPSKDIAAFIGTANFLEGTLKRTDGLATVDTDIGSVRVTLPGDAASLEDGVTVSVLVRPESVSCTVGEKVAADAVNVYAGTIRRVQFLGNTIDADVHINGTVLHASLAAAAPPQDGDIVSVHLPPDECRVVI